METKTCQPISGVAESFKTWEGGSIGFGKTDLVRKSFSLWVFQK
jgi:hypothetical protein